MNRPPDPREERYRPLGRMLSVAVVVVALAGAVSLAAGTEVAETAGVLMIVVLVATPMLRVLWLVSRWFRRGDNRYALTGLAVLLIPLVGFVLSR